jgi:hypothetical protein
LFDHADADGSFGLGEAIDDKCECLAVASFHGFAIAWGLELLVRHAGAEWAPNKSPGNYESSVIESGVAPTSTSTDNSCIFREKILGYMHVVHHCRQPNVGAPMESIDQFVVKNM